MKKILLSEKSGKNATYLTFTQGLEHPAIRKGVCDTLKKCLSSPDVTMPPDNELMNELKKSLGWFRALSC